MSIIGARMRTPATRFEVAFECAGDMGDVGRSAALVEADDAIAAGFHRRLRHADDAAGRTRKDGVLAPEQIGGRQAAGRGHEHQPRPGAGRFQFMLDLRHIAPEDGRQIGIHDRGVAAPDQLDERADLVRHRHLTEADLARDGPRFLLVSGVAEACMKA